MAEVDVTIVGGGLAGLSLAYHLARGGSSVHLLERAGVHGAHASGRNARLVLQAVAEPVLRTLVARSAAAYARLADEVGFVPRGSLQLGAAADLDPLRQADEVRSRQVSRDEGIALAPLLADHAFAAGLLTPADGVLDPHRLLAFYRDGAIAAGARISLEAAVVAIDGEGPCRVITDTGMRVHAARIVLAPGAWASELAALAGVPTPPLVARKRHLFLLAHRLPADQPYVWDLPGRFYFRADDEGTLACMCDERLDPSLAETVDADAEGELRRRLTSLPGLSGARLVRAWACFRTRTPDGLPLVGPDPHRPHVWWLAGLAGHGLGCSWELGRLAAGALRDGAVHLPAELRADRLLAAPTSAGA